MSLPHAVLGVLATGPRHGRAVARALALLLDGLRPVNAGQVYATLARLTRQQRITIARRAPSAARRSGAPTYALLPSGRRELRRWLERAGVESALRCGFVDRLIVLHALHDAPGVARLVAVRRARVMALHVGLDTGERPARDAAVGDGRTTFMRALARAAALRILAAELTWLDDVERTLLPERYHVAERIDAQPRLTPDA